MLSIEKSLVLKLHKSNLVQCTKTTFMVDRATFTDMAGLFWPIVFCKWCFAALSFITWWTMHAILGFFCNLSTTVTKCMWDICLGGFTWDQPVVFVLSTGCPNLHIFNLFSKMFWLTVRKNWNSDQKMFWKFKAEGQ